MRLNLDRSYFSVICDFGNALYAPERELAEMTLEEIVSDVRAGQLEDVCAVLEFNPAEGWCNDVTSDVLTAAFPNSDTLGSDDFSDYGRERLDGHRAGVTMRIAA